MQVGWSSFPPAYAQYRQLAASLEQLEIGRTLWPGWSKRAYWHQFGRNVKISAAAVSHGNLTVAAAERRAVQPEPFAGGRTAVPRTEAVVEEQEEEPYR